MEAWFRGVDLPMSLLVYAVVILMSGILVNARFAFFMTMLITAVAAAIGYIQTNHIHAPDLYWKNESTAVADIAIFGFLFFVINLFSWISDREVKRSIMRARLSERELESEREKLEASIEERARELRDAQAERIDQLYRFAEFGRISSGLFHDLLNPLNAVALSVEQMEGQEGLDARCAGGSLSNAIKASKRLQAMIAAVRKQLSREMDRISFAAIKEVRDAAEILSFKARSANVEIRILDSSGDCEIFGDPSKFNQAVINLIANSIDAYDGIASETCGAVSVFLTRDRDQLVLKVEDAGCGIRPDCIEKIFEPFFTTKPAGKGIGIGLSMVKRIVETDFHGSVAVKSAEKLGASFTVRVPASAVPIGEASTGAQAMTDMPVMSACGASIRSAAPR
ncbi:MAG: HAMP domain-containing histidine kinase [Patescibacteria group bacterium]|nr:HAMP domain-containing histidine kinase [Patescibacteria group bacterium]MDE1966967.1 HAMP domain-containing histidine kinase [Patescibacteria group bacterium]